MKRHIGKFVRLGITAIVLVMLVLFAFRVDWHATWHAIRASSPSILALAAIVNLLSLVVKGIRWWIFLRPIGASSLWLALRATFAGAGLNNVLVANGGEAARVIFIARTAHIPSSRVLATLALERLFELVGYAMMLALAALFLQLPPILHGARPFALLALVAMMALLVYLLRHPGQAAVVELETTRLGQVKDWVARFASTMAQVSTLPRFAAALGLSVLVWALQVATYHLTAMAAGFPIPLVGTVAALLAVNLGFALRATPGNVGLFQFLYAATAVAFGLSKDAAIAVAFLIQTQQILPVTAIGVALAPEFIYHKRKAPRPGEPALPGEPQEAA